MNAPAHTSAVPVPHRKWPRVLALIVVVVVLLALVAATFVLSYDGVRAVALQAGVSVKLARIYPGILDAALVIACAAALLLRDGKWWARWYAWLAIILIMAVAGGTDAVHAMSIALPRKQTEGVVAAAPWLLVLVAFSLWLTILRQSRGAHRHNVATPEPISGAPEALSGLPEPVPGIPEAVPGIPEALPTVPEALPTVPEPTAVMAAAPAASVPGAEPQVTDLAPEETTAPAEADQTVAGMSEPSDAVELEQTADEAVETEDAPEAPEVAEVAEAPEAAEAPEVAEAAEAAEDLGIAATDGADPDDADSDNEGADNEGADGGDEALRSEAPGSDAPEPAADSDVDTDVSTDTESPAGPTRATDEPTVHGKPPAPPLDYWDTYEDESDYASDGSATVFYPAPATEVHHSLDDDAELSPSTSSTPRLRRVRSTPIPPEVEAGEVDTDEEDAL